MPSVGIWEGGIPGWAAHTVDMWSSEAQDGGMWKLRDRPAQHRAAGVETVGIGRADELEEGQSPQAAQHAGWAGQGTLRQRGRRRLLGGGGGVALKANRIGLQTGWGRVLALEGAAGGTEEPPSSRQAWEPPQPLQDLDSGLDSPAVSSALSRQNHLPPSCLTQLKILCWLAIWKL